MNKRIVWPVAALLAAALAGCGVAGRERGGRGHGRNGGGPHGGAGNGGGPGGQPALAGRIRRRALLHGGLVRAGQRLCRRGGL